MKPFSQSLERVLDFRRRKLEFAEAALQRTRAQQLLWESRVRTKLTESTDVRTEILSQETIQGRALSAMQGYLDALEREQQQASEAAAELEEDKRRQLDDVLAARRNLRVIERLKERRQREHQRRLAGKVEQETAEWSLARYVRRQRESYAPAESDPLSKHPRKSVFQSRAHFPSTIPDPVR